VTRTGVFGGSFNPPHNAHVRIAEAFIDQFALDRLIVVPTSVPPHKKIDNDDPATRRDMARLAFEGLRGITEVSDIELKRSGKSYTSDTLAALTRIYGGELLFLCGADMLMTLDTWHEPERIFALATVVCAKRYENDDTAEQKRLEYVKKYNASIAWLDLPPMPLSSTCVREAIESGGDWRGLVPQCVADYIIKNRLYGT
jgi:nicotinate-nucleotide adenylyltransferase